MPRVSVLMPVYNSAAYVRDALASIRDQSFRDFELIVIDDGSSDESVALLEAFAAQEPRMRLIKRSNRGLIATRNQLLEEASGEFIAWMDSDDLSHPDRLKHQVAAFDSDDSLVCIGSNVELIDPEGEYLGFENYPQDHEAILAEQMLGSGLRFPSTMQRRSVAIGVGGFREPFHMGEDFDYLLRIGESGRMANLPDRLYFYRQHLVSICSSLGANWPVYREVILSLASERRRHGTDRLQRGEKVVIPQAKPEDARRYVPTILLGWAGGAFSHGDRGRALRYTLSAIRAAPLKRAGWRHLAKLLLGSRFRATPANEQRPTGARGAEIG
jgi:glycosyltransferase involved in cell wall biosynthesis